MRFPLKLTTYSELLLACNLVKKVVNFFANGSLEIQVSAIGVATPEEWMWLESAGTVFT